MLPDDFHAVDQHGQHHEIRSILHASPEFLTAMSKEVPRKPCPCENCHDGFHMSPVYGKVRIAGLEFQGITGIRNDGPCSTCAGMGFVYGVCPN